MQYARAAGGCPLGSAMPCMQLEVSQQPPAATPVPSAPPCMRRHVRKQTIHNAQGKVKRGSSCSPALAAAAAVALPLPSAAYKHRSARGQRTWKDKSACGDQQLPLWEKRRHWCNAQSGSSAQHHKVYKACFLALPDAQGSVKRDTSCLLDAASAAAVALALPPAG